ncbi:MAG TPA: pyrroloquinoline quinone-dependent dehydrogenase [Thermoanaerobaculia bacterium]|nr:pyrroloquinoline quinone-dependent dehydrogenase [Thermoanaerobaculia bacterium]
MLRHALAALLLATPAAALAFAPASRGENGAPPGEWRHYGADRASSRYSALDQIDRSNVTTLVEAWRWRSPDDEIHAREPRYRPGVFKPTPLMVGGRVILPTSLGLVVALDPATGDTLWTHDPASYWRGRPANAGWQHRGVEYWTDGTIERILFATHDRRLISIDPATGKPDPAFGVDGEGFTDLSLRLGREINVRHYTHNSPPIVCRDTVVVGSIVSDGPTTPEMPPGHVRGYDVRTGAMKWIFHTIPQEGEHGVETWQDESWKVTGNTNVWTTMSCDQELGYVYLPTSTPTNDWYGGHRKGDNLFAEAIVALDASTGERKWHFQAVRHGLWDYDFPCAPNLVDLTVDGRPRRALAQVSKQGFTYVLDRVTGEPIWPIEERPVPQSTVPGEQTAATQPHPTKPPPFERQGVTEDDLIDFTPELRQMALDLVADYVTGPLYTPPIVTGEGGKKGTLMLPSAAGGANWRGAAWDPETGMLYVPSMTLLMINALTKGDPARVKFDYVYNSAGGWLLSGPDDLPIVKPPWGRITAYDLNEGEIAWVVPHGRGPRDHPLLAGLDLPERLGAAANGVLSNGGPLLTKTLLFVIQAEESPKDMMRMGDTGFLAAFDKATGELIWEQRMTPTPHGNPMTYLHAGRQYVVVAAGGGLAGTLQPSELVAFALPAVDDGKR